MPVLNDQIVRLYDTIFDRAPDPDGLAFWNGVADQGYGLPYVAGQFMVAPEFAATYGQPDNAAFVRSMYANVLDREGEAEGVAFWTRALDEGLADRARIVVEFSESPEHIARMPVPVPVPEPVPVSSPGVVRTSDGPIYGTPGDDTIYGRDYTGPEPAPVQGRFSPGEDPIAAGDGDDLVYGLGGPDHIRGGAGADTIHGGSSNDAISGEDGDDTLIGGPGDDRIDGGRGHDVFVLAPGDGTDTFGDFERGDLIQIVGVPDGGFGFSTLVDPAGGSGMLLRFGPASGGDWSEGALLRGLDDRDLWWLQDSVFV